jgi:hypothetical protein
MFKSISYNVNYKKAGKYDAEKEALHTFNASNHENMRLEYDSSRETIYARQAVLRYIKMAKMPLSVTTNGKSIVIFRVAK